MKYGVLGGFIKLAFAKTAFAYMEKEVPGLDMAAYKKRTLTEYRAIVERTPAIGSMKDNMFVMTMYCGAFAITHKQCGICKLTAQEHCEEIAKHLCMMDYYTFEMQGAVLDRTKTLGYGDDECNFHLMSRARAEELGFTPGPDAK